MDSNLFPLQNSIKKILDDPKSRPALPVLEDGSSVGDDNFGEADRYDTGKSPDVALNNKNVVVEVHKSEKRDRLFYHVGRVNGDKIDWYESHDYDDGVEPSVAITNDGLVVEVHKSQGLKNTLWYRLGQVEGNTITWRNGGKSIEYDNGQDHSVAITNDGLVVEVHKSADVVITGSNNTLWYRLGQVEGDKINWRNNEKSIEYDNGVRPSVAITDDGLVVEVHQSGGPRDSLWYRLGKVEGNEINWRNNEKSIEYDIAVNPSVAITNDGLVVAVHSDSKVVLPTTPPSPSVLSYRLGQVEGDTIAWRNDDKSINYGNGGLPRVACNGQLAVETHVEGSDQLFCSVLTLPAFRSNWIELRGENSYCYCACNSATDNKQRHASNKTMNVKEGAPYLYAVLTKDDDSIDFPTGAIMTITGPDGTNYNRDIEEENQLVIMSGSSVRCLIVKDPKPGDWKMTMTVPEGVGFHCECNTVPSKDVYDTITETLNSRSAKTGLQPRNLIVVVGFIGLAIAWLAKPTKAASNQELNYQNFLRAGTGDLGLQVTDSSFAGMGVNETAEVLAESSRTAAQRQQAEYEYNLEMPERPGAPYNALDRYNTNLTDHRPLRGDNYPVEVMRHHIIPDSRLREFWNRMLAQDNFNAARGLLSTLESNVRDYQMTLNQSDRDQLRELLRGIIGGQIRHNPSARRPDGFDNLAAVYEWLPGNLFIGPRGGGGEYQRHDDPGDGFEERAGVVVNGDFQPWIRAQFSILGYLNTADPSAARDAIINLSSIARRKKPFDIDPNVWDYSNKRYRLRDS